MGGDAETVEAVGRVGVGVNEPGEDTAADSVSKVAPYSTGAEVIAGLIHWPKTGVMPGAHRGV